MKSWIAFILGTLLVFFHWSMVAFYIGPPTPISDKITPLNIAYIVPIFNQNWRLFAPEPPVISLSLAYQCQLKNKSWSAFREPAQELLEKHYKYRITYHGKLLALVESIARNLNNERAKMQSDYIKNGKQSENYLIAERFVKDLCTSEFGTFLSQKIYIVSRKVIPFSKKNEMHKREENLIDFTL